MKKTIVTAVYTLGALIVFALVCLFLSHSRYVPSPDAMLPMQLWELAVDWLALGTLPMTAACILMCSAYGTRGRKTALLFLPAIPCMAALLFWIGVWVVGMVNMLLHG